MMIINIHDITEYIVLQYIIIVTRHNYSQNLNGSIHTVVPLFINNSLGGV